MVAAGRLLLMIAAFFSFSAANVVEDDPMPVYKMQLPATSDKYEYVMMKVVWFETEKNESNTKRRQLALITSVDVDLQESKTKGICFEDSHCSVTQTCAGGVCVNPCHVADMCGLNTVCETVNHRAVCTCQTGYVYGDPRLGCKKNKNFLGVKIDMSWWNATEYCRNRGGDLANILSLKDRREYEIEANKFRSPAWMGAFCNKGNTASCYWETSKRKTPLASYEMNWHESQPSASNGFGAYFNCASSRSEYSQKWALSNCYNSQYFVCQFYD